MGVVTKDVSVQQDGSEPARFGAGPLLMRL